MRRATVTIPDDLEASLERYLAQQNTPPSFTTLVQVALRDYLHHEALRVRGYEAPSKPFDPQPLVEKDDCGEPDVSINHDVYLGKP